MDIQTALETMIYNSLSQDQDIISIVGTNPNNLSTQYQIYNEQAPIKAPYPFIVFYPIYGLNMHDTQSVSYNFHYRIICWSYNIDTSRKLLGYVTDILHNKQLNAGDKLAYHIIEREFIHLIANVEGNQVYGRGANFEFKCN